MLIPRAKTDHYEFSYFIMKTLYCVYSLEASHRDYSNEYCMKCRHRAIRKTSLKIRGH